MNDFYRKQRKRQRLKNGLAITAAMVLLLFAFLFPQYIDKDDTEDAKRETLINLKNDSFATLISSGHTVWSYRDSGVLPERDSEGRTWMEAGYDVSGWKSGKGTFGSVEGKRIEQVDGRCPINLLNYYKENRVSVPIYYFRTEFDLANVSEDLILNGSIQFDDSVVIYLNGKKLHTENVPKTGFDVDGYGAKTIVRKFAESDFTIDDLPMLKQGRNVIAV